MPRRMMHDAIIAQPITVVFAQLTRLDRWPEWLTAVLEARQTSSGPLGVGATFSARIQEGKHARELAGEIIAYEPPHVVAYRDCAASGMATVRYTLEAVAGGTRVRVTVGTASAPLAAMVMRSVRHALGALKTSLETGSAPADGGLGSSDES